MDQALTHRLARREELEALKALMEAAISELQKPFLDTGQIASSRAIMGLDTQLIDDPRSQWRSAGRSPVSFARSAAMRRRRCWWTA